LSEVERCRQSLEVVQGMESEMDGEREEAPPPMGVAGWEEGRGAVPERSTGCEMMTKDFLCLVESAGEGWLDLLWVMGEGEWEGRGSGGGGGMLFSVGEAPADRFRLSSLWREALRSS
jgi:hypothetical protein